MPPRSAAAGCGLPRPRVLRAQAAPDRDPRRSWRSNQTRADFTILVALDPRRGPVRSILFQTSTCGIASAPISASTVFTASICALARRARCIDHVQQQIGLDGFLQRGAERRDQAVRQMADEANRVRQHHGAPDSAGKYAPRRRVERREQLVGGVAPGRASSALNSVDLPALVYPTSDTDSTCARRARAAAPRAALACARACP